LAKPIAWFAISFAIFSVGILTSMGTAASQIVGDLPKISIQDSWPRPDLENMMVRL
jgi:hypothetical protein